MLKLRCAELIQKGKEIKTDLQVIPVYAWGKWGMGHGARMQGEH